MLYTPRGFPPSYLASCLSLTITHYHSLSLTIFSFTSERNWERRRGKGREGREEEMHTGSRRYNRSSRSSRVVIGISTALARIGRHSQWRQRSFEVSAPPLLFFSSSFENISLWKCFGNFQKTDCCPFKEGERERKDFLLPNWCENHYLFCLPRVSFGHESTQKRPFFLLLRKWYSFTTWYKLKLSWTKQFPMGVGWVVGFGLVTPLSFSEQQEQRCIKVWALEGRGSDWRWILSWWVNLGQAWFFCVELIVQLEGLTDWLEKPLGFVSWVLVLFPLQSCNCRRGIKRSCYLPGCEGSLHFAPFWYKPR